MVYFQYLRFSPFQCSSTNASLYTTLVIRTRGRRLGNIKQGNGLLHIWEHHIKNYRAFLVLFDWKAPALRFASRSASVTSSAACRWGRFDSRRREADERLVAITTFRKSDKLTTAPGWRSCSSRKDHPIKVKFTLEQAMKVQRGSRGIALLFL
jgi:hypothetical protein